MAHVKATDRSGWLRAWPAVLLAAVGIFGYLLNTTHWFTMVPGDLGDPRFNSIILEHFYQWLQGKSASLWSPEFFYPYADALAFSDNHFGTAWIYSLGRFAGLSRETGFDAWFCTGFLLTYVCSVYAGRKFGFGWPAAAAAAFIFTFSPAMLAQESHAQLIYRYAIPLAVLELWRIVEQRQRERLPWLGIWMAVQFFCSIYLGFFLTMLVGAITVASIAMSMPLRRPFWAEPAESKRPQQIGAKLVSALLWLGLLLMLGQYHAVAKKYGFRHDPGEIRNMLPHIGSYFIADGTKIDAWMGRWVTNIPMRHEHQMFFGLIACILALIGVLLGRRTKQWSRPVSILGIALLLLIALTLSVHGISLYRVVMRIPGFNSIRAVTRISLVMLLPVAWLAATGIETLAGRFPRLRLHAFLAIAVLLAIELVSYTTMHVPNAEWRDRLSALYSGAKPAPTTQPPIIFALETSHESYRLINRELDGMMLAQDLGAPSANGYSGNLPRDFGSADSCMTGAYRLINGAAFRHLPATDVSSMLRRLTVLPASSQCPDFSALQVYTGPLPDNVFQQVSLSVVDQKSDGSDYLVTVELKNRSDHYLPALSTDDKPVQFSWQFVSKGQVPDSGAWTPRSPLAADVAAGSDYRQILRVTPPKAAGQYTLALTLVQDKVSWFHDKGMHIAVGNAPIQVPNP
ncbi:hypothetical protein [Dyella acidiphila]|uniref:Glycosyltransferase RgtA/B/C/D-like domain-containing protein n=1 Tax=Dyella acidiphila TaxID=2775866 RepID=A0ABR9G547_9GAMM|nr:hypothetical protein [Dyella acidiphila]MBE1159180.1 hypothetical protein [Dyella acidiphila]